MVKFSKDPQWRDARQLAKVTFKHMRNAMRQNARSQFIHFSDIDHRKMVSQAMRSTSASINARITGTKHVIHVCKYCKGRSARDQFTRVQLDKLNAIQQDMLKELSLEPKPISPECGAVRIKGTIMTLEKGFHHIIHLITERILRKHYPPRVVVRLGKYQLAT